MQRAERDRAEGRSHRVTIHFSKSGRNLLDLATTRTPLLPYASEGTQHFDIVVAALGATVTALSAEGKPAWTIARHTGGGATWWDHDTQQQMRWNAAEVKCTDGATPDDGATAVQLDDKSRIALVRRADPGLGMVEMRIHCVPSEVPDTLRAWLLDALFGNGCNPGLFPSAKVAALGSPRLIELFVDGQPEALVTTEIDEGQDIGTDGLFDPPADYKDIAPTPGKEPPPTPTADTDETNRWQQAANMVPRIGRSQQALEVEDVLTPGCLANTRLGPMVGVVHQDLLDNIRSAVNLLTPHLGTVTLAGGTLTIPWLASLASADFLSGGTAPGSGIFTLLRDPRQLSPVLKGGAGLLDRLAWKMMITPDPSTGQTKLQQEASAGTLAATLTRWNVGSAIESILLSNGGNIKDTRLTDEDRSRLVEAFEVFDIGTITLPAIPAAPPPILWPTPAPGGPNLSLVTLTITGITGTMTFGPVGSPPTVPLLSIGSGGTIDITISLPAITLAATVARATTPLGTGVLIGAALTCFFFPLSCFTLTPTALLLLAILQDLSRFTAVIPTTTLTYRVEFAYDQNTRHVEPTITLMGAAGTATVTSTSSQPSSIAAAFNNLVISLGNSLNAWPLVLGASIGVALQDTLRKQGVRFPLGLTQGLSAMDGTALSTANDTLSLIAEMEPVANTVAQPWITQVPTAALVRNRTELTHFLARRELNPSVITGTMPASLSVGVYGGLALTQNVLNSYVYAQWRAGAFNLDITWAPLVFKLVDTLPQGTFGVNRPQRITVWPATPPRLELAPEGLHAGEAVNNTTDPTRRAELAPFSTGPRPLVAYFDDVRVCFGAGAIGGTDGLQSGQWEFSFNFRTTATLDLQWPFALALRTDAGPGAVTLTEGRTMEFADGALLSSPLDPAYQNWLTFASEVANLVANRQSGASTSGDWNAPPWKRPNPWVVQKPGGDMLSLEMLAARKTLTMLPMFRSPVLELLDGSGAPTVALILGIPTPVPLGTLSRAQGLVVRNFIVPFLNPAGLVAFPGP